MCKTSTLAIGLCSIILTTVIVFIFNNMPVCAQHTPGAFLDSPASYSSLACRQYVSGKKNESIALYQKAIDKASREYGANSLAVGSLNYEMAVRAYDVGKFDLAERSLKKAVAINPSCLAAQLMLSQLLKFRDKNNEAYKYMAAASNKYWDAPEVRRELMLCLQDTDPAGAAQQAFIINCLQNGLINRIPTEQRPSAPVHVAVSSPTQPAVTVTSHKEVRNNTQKTGQSQLGNAQISDIQSKITQLERALQGINKTAGKETDKIAIKHSVKTKSRSGHGHKSEHSPSLLVPPPPLPTWFGVPDKSNPTANTETSPAHTSLKAHTGKLKIDNRMRKAETNKDQASKSEDSAPAAKTSSAKAAHTTPESEPDFLLDWAAIKKKNAK